MATKRTSSDDKVTASKKQKSGSGHWSLGLLDTIQDSKNVVHEDDMVVAIKDKYPKAQFHYLVMPKENIASLKSVTAKHVELLKHMESIGEKLAKDQPGMFRIGYHAEASMFRLHLHVISKDMNSVCLKTKQHWNSFTTEFFLLSADVREQLETTGKISLPSKEACKKLLNTALVCNKCDYEPKNMPDLKRHIISHK